MRSKAGNLRTTRVSSRTVCSSSSFGHCFFERSESPVACNDWDPLFGREASWVLEDEAGDRFPPVREAVFVDPCQKVSGTFRATGERYGFSDVNASFHPFKEFKTVWERSGAQVEFKVTDYLEGADPSVLGDFAECLFTRIKQRRREAYSDRLRAWLRSDEFVGRNRPLYLERSRNLTLSPIGEAYDLLSLADSLRTKGLIQDGHEAFLSWTDRPNRSRMGYCSTLMRVAAISSALDDEKVPGFVAEYVLYHELLHLELGVESLRSYHDAAFRAAERRYPQWRDAERWLKRVATS